MNAVVEVDDEENALQSEQVEAPDEMKLAGENRRNWLREKIM